MPSRRDLLLGASAGLLLAGCGDGDDTPGPGNAEGLGEGDLGVVRFALQLEYFERDLYEELERSGPLRGLERRLARDFGEVEAEHAETLEGILRGERAPLPEPLEADFERLVSGSRREVLELLVQVEDLGADAYLGAAPDVLDRGALALALSIHSVEARHAAAFRRRLGRSPTPEGAFAAPVTPNDVASRLGELLAA